MRTVTTRTQRRMERKQAMLLLLMVLAVALVSFTLGVMVGRSGSAEVVAGEAGSGGEIVTKHPAPEPAVPEEETAREADANLTFYETLPKGEKSPMGSGINLPPEKEEIPVEVEPAAEKVAEKVAEKAALEGAGETRTVEMSPERPASSSDAGETFLLQVASFRSIKGALALQEKLHRKGYPTQVREVDLDEKGVWSRVVVGPFESRSEAQATLERLKSEEHLSPMLRKG